MNEERRYIALTLQQHTALMEMITGIAYPNLYVGGSTVSGKRTFMGIPIGWEDLPLVKEEEEYKTKW